ncbi:ABC transporter substrate-binding protein [Treponema phagedenis]|uniref:ABC transporter substrate-binding protein n=1 Tax=Treponema phagedenis TaxID=162 RepID=UPI0011E6BECD|nr:ABC transporter substrate-binding protein [Treponema phagedenis]QEJ99990.1 ABC transporter substrate-binding protein [Treponema phagedenis]QEK04932.1 ABC transporter substrate-binding protein [Treponema phagedenis]QEK10553.1 ABC transporter substrate-binding protein [Treponema phagedenis]
MKKRIVLFCVACVAAMSLLSCGSDSGGQEKKSLMVYTSMKESIIGKVRDEFSQKYPDINFDYYSAGAGKLMAKIAAERQSGRIACDVLWTSEVPDFMQLKAEGVLLPYVSPESGKIVSPLKDPEGYFTPARLGTLGIAYNTNKIKTPPVSWQDLLKPEYKNGFAIANPALSGTSLVSLAMLIENLGWDYIEQLKANGAKMGQGSGQVVDDTASGDISACIAVDYITIDKIVKGATLGFAYPQEMLVVPSPIAIMKDTQNEDSAKIFIDFLLSDEGQKIVADAYTLPIKENIPVREDLGLLHPEAATQRAFPFDYQKLIREKEEVIKRFTALMNQR